MASQPLATWGHKNFRDCHKSSTQNNIGLVAQLMIDYLTTKLAYEIQILK
jgi:hypothetical protein